MTEVLITNDKSKQVQPILEYRHNYKYVPNRAYAVNVVDKAISRGQFTIVLDESKLKQNSYKHIAMTKNFRDKLNYPNLIIQT